MKRPELAKLYHNYNNVSVPDKDFNPARNKAVIEETIREAEKYHKTVHQLLDDSMGERIEAVSSYGAYRFNGGEKSHKDYFGRRLMTRFMGEKLLSKLRVMDTVNKLNNNKRFKNAILL